MNTKTYVSVGSVTSYQTKAGRRWRWQAVAATKPGNVKAPRLPVGEAGFHSKREAQDARDEGRRLIQLHGSEKTEHAEAIMTLEQVAQKWLDSIDLAASTLAGYRRNIRNHVVPYLGDKDIREVSVNDFNELYVTLAKNGRKDSKEKGSKLKAATVIKVHQNVLQICAFAKRRDYVEQSLVVDDRWEIPRSYRVKEEAEEVEIWSISEARKVLDWNELNENDDLHVLWRLIAETGVRRGEAIALKWKDINWESGKVSINKAADSARARMTKPTKTYRIRSLGIPEELVKRLLRHKQSRAQFGKAYVSPNSFIFGNEKNELRSPNDVSKRWSNMVRRARAAIGEDQIPRVTLKGLRHSHATQMLEAGIVVKFVQERLGHSDIVTTLNIYAHSTNIIEDKAMVVIAEMWRGEAQA